MNFQNIPRTRADGSRPSNSGRRLVIYVALAVAASACIRPAAAPPSRPDARGAEQNATETRTGIFHTVWGERPQYFLTGEDGRTVPLLFDEAITHPHGGPRALDRKRVVVSGTLEQGPTGPMFRATGITLAPGT